MAYNIESVRRDVNYVLAGGRGASLAKQRLQKNAVVVSDVYYQLSSTQEAKIAEIGLMAVQSINAAGKVTDRI